jgi:hypothetical protein
MPLGIKETAKLNIGPEGRFSRPGFEYRFIGIVLERDRQGAQLLQCRFSGSR